MTLRYPTASGLERALACPSSCVLPKVYDAPGAYALDGVDLHDALQALVEGRPVPSGLQAWAEAARDEAGPILADASVLAEAAFCFDAEWEAGELLGRNLGRNYGSAPARGYCGAADYVRCVDGVVEVLDLKTGYGAVTPPADNAQLLLLALAASHHYGDAMPARVGLLWAPKDATPRVEWAEVSWPALNVFRGRLADLTEALRDYYASGTTLPVNAGPHCTYCKSRTSCPVMAQREKDALALPQASRLVVDESNAGEVWAKVDEARAVLDELKTACIQVALRAGGVRLPNGKVRRQVTREVEALEAEAVWAELVRRWGPSVAKAGVGLEASKASILRGVKAAKEAGAAGSAAALQREVLEAVRAAGGVEKKARAEWEDV